MYRYSSPVFLEPHSHPAAARDRRGAAPGSWTLGITPAPVGRNECLDQDGNYRGARLVRRADRRNSRSHTEFSLRTLRGNPFDYLLTAVDAKLPMEYALPLRAALPPYMRQSSSDGSHEFARALAKNADGRPWHSSARSTSGCSTARARSSAKWVLRLPRDTTLREQEGSCRDLAVLFCAACRAVGSLPVS